MFEVYVLIPPKIIYLTFRGLQTEGIETKYQSFTLITEKTPIIIWPQTNKQIQDKIIVLALKGYFYRFFANWFCFSLNFSKLDINNNAISITEEIKAG